MSDPLRVCLLCEESMSRWQIAATERMLAQTDATITCAVINQEPERSARETVARALELREWALVAGLRSLFRRFDDKERPDSGVPLSEIDFLSDVERIPCRPEIVDGWQYRLPGEDVAAASARADVAVLFGFGFVVGPVLEAFDHGVLSFHHGNLREYRGQPMGFWEFVNDESVGGVTLQRLNDTLDGGEIIAVRRVPIHDADRWGEVRRRLFEASRDLLAEGVRRVEDDSFSPDRPESDELGDLYTLPHGRPVASYVAKSVGRTLRPW